MAKGGFAEEEERGKEEGMEETWRGHTIIVWAAGLSTVCSVGGKVGAIRRLGNPPKMTSQGLQFCGLFIYYVKHLTLPTTQVTKKKEEQRRPAILLSAQSIHTNLDLCTAYHFMFLSSKSFWHYKGF